LILDEPMSGLDPVGRKEVRDLILDERRQGRTIFFSTHILNDVETLCDRVTILRSGEVVVSGAISELLRRDTQRTDVTLAGNYAAFAADAREHGLALREAGGHLVLRVEGPQQLAETLARALQEGLQVLEVAPREETLETLFVREAIGDGDRAA